MEHYTFFYKLLRIASVTFSVKWIYKKLGITIHNQIDTFYHWNCRIIDWTSLLFRRFVMLSNFFLFSKIPKKIMKSLQIYLPDGTAVTVKVNPSPGETVLCWSLSKRMIIILVGPRFCLVNVAPPEFPQILWTISFMHVKFWWYWIHSHCNVFFIAVNNKDKHSFFNSFPDVFYNSVAQ